MPTYKVISNKYQTTGKFTLDEFDTIEEAQDMIKRIAAQKEEKGYCVCDLENEGIEVTHDDMAEVTAYYIETVNEEVEEYDEY